LLSELLVPKKEVLIIDPEPVELSKPIQRLFRLPESVLGRLHEAKAAGPIRLQLFQPTEEYLVGRDEGEEGGGHVPQAKSTAPAATTVKKLWATNVARTIVRPQATAPPMKARRYHSMPRRTPTFRSAATAR
jgi:hypothetical protein